METREEWEEWYARPNPWDNEGSLEDRVRIRAVTERLAMARFRLALDLGCGEGFMTSALARTAERTLAFDISGQAVRRAQARFPAIEFAQGEIREVARRPDVVAMPFDFVSVAEVLYYLQDDRDRAEAVEAIHGLGLPQCLFFFSVLVAGENKYRKYFTRDSFMELIRPHFNVVDCFPFVAYRPKWIEGALHVMPDRLALATLRQWTQLRSLDHCKHVGFFALKR